jgi:hypothetical protein
MKAILKLYTPHRVQLAAHNSLARFKVLCVGRQAGKSTFCNQEMAKKAWENPNTRYAFISPIFSQAKEQYRRQVQTLPIDIIKRRSDTELRIELINNSVMEYLSGDNPHSLRGKTLNGVLIDEVRDQAPELWNEVIRPMLATTKGWAIFASTPRGFDTFYDLAQKSFDDPEWELFSAPSTCNPLFSQAEYESAKKEMGEAQFAQEIMAEFRDLHDGSAYVNFTEANCKTSSPFLSEGQIYSPYLPLVIGLDFNLTPMSWCIGQQRLDDFYFFDEIHLKKSHTQEATMELIGRVKQMNIKAKPQIILAGDATSKSGQRAAAGKSDYSILCEMLSEAGISWQNRTPDSNPMVKDRVNIVNAKLRSADGTHHLFIHPTRCPYLKKDFQRVAWKQGASMILDQITDPLLTHMSDGAGYAVCALSDMWSPSVGSLHVIKRKPY